MKTKMTDTVECPYCKHENEMTEDDDNGVHECEECEKEFNVTVEYNPVYSSECTDENHEFEEEEDYVTKTNYNFCRFCGKGKLN